MTKTAYILLIGFLVLLTAWAVFTYRTRRSVTVLPSVSQPTQHYLLYKYKGDKE